MWLLLIIMHIWDKKIINYYFYYSQLSAEKYHFYNPLWKISQALISTNISYLIRSYNDVLVTKGNGHDRDEKSEEGFQLSKAVLVEAQEGEGVGDGDQDAAPERNRFVGKQINCDGSPDNFLKVL